MNRLSTSLGSYPLSSPLIAASGTLGSLVEFADVVDFSVYGAATAKSVSPEPWQGNAVPRLAHTHSGILNAIGIQNPGIESWIASYAEGLRNLPTEVWGSVVAHGIDGFHVVASSMADAGVAAIEINLSCPNLAGATFALEPSISADVVAAVRDATDLPIGAKLSSDAQPISAVAQAVSDAGADWVIVSNTVMGASIDPVTRRPLLSGLIGGYSGAPIRPIAIRSVLEISRDLPDLAIVGCGGVSKAEHVIEFLLAGASAVAIGSAHFKSPRVAGRISRDLTRFLKKHDIVSISELIGAYERW